MFVEEKVEFGKVWIAVACLVGAFASSQGAEGDSPLTVSCSWAAEVDERDFATFQLKIRNHSERDVWLIRGKKDGPDFVFQTGTSEGIWNFPEGGYGNSSTDEMVKLEPGQEAQVESSFRLFSISKLRIFLPYARSNDRMAFEGRSSMAHVEELDVPDLSREAGDEPIIRLFPWASGKGAANVWEDHHLAKGATTSLQIEKMFGKDSGNLDVPGRANELALQYVIGFNHLGPVLLHLHFDPETKVLRDWGISKAICGFCPHIFSHDGDWRLEGKMLAGRVGVKAEGADWLLLPRLKEQDGKLLVKVANLAPEIDYIRNPVLYSTVLAEGEELDVTQDGAPQIWQPHKEIRC